MQHFGFHWDTTYTSLPESFFSFHTPKTSSNPSTVVVNHSLAKDLGLHLSQPSSHDLAQLFSGNTDLGSRPFCQAYAGHQFGHLSLLGDGRAHCLGEHLSPKNERFDIQFKGSGKTDYSRSGDGLAALGPMLREYIISEAMHFLGIPTTRSLAVVTTGDTVWRQTPLPGAVLTRVSPSYLRIGTFELAATMDDIDALQSLFQYSLDRHFPHLSTSNNPALAFLECIMDLQIKLMVHWMRVGFIHGVMNTDNISICGNTLDYGPCAFMDHYHPLTVFSSIDHQGRYAFTNQPRINQWNCARLAETLLPLIHAEPSHAIDLASSLIQQWPTRYHHAWLDMMRHKLGIIDTHTDDHQLIGDLLDWMQHNNIDYTNTFDALTRRAPLDQACYQQPPFLEWLQRLQVRKKSLCPDSSLTLMKHNNPVIIPRNHQVERVLTAAHNQDYEPLKALLHAVSQPYEYHSDMQDYHKPPSASERIHQTFCGT